MSRKICYHVQNNASRPYVNTSKLASLYDKGLLAPSLTPKIEDNHLFAVGNCLLSIFTVIICI